MRRTEKTQVSRRRFLRDSAAVGAGAAIVASAPASALDLAETGPAEPKARGYRLTEHIASYYRTAAE